VGFERELGHENQVRGALSARIAQRDGTLGTILRSEKAPELSGAFYCITSFAIQS
jgi:hypothetical protein